MRKFVLIAGLILLVAASAMAQEAPKAEVSLGYSYVRVKPSTSGAPSFNLNGGSGSVALNVTRSLGIVGDFGGYHVKSISSIPVSGNIYSYLFGPRVSYRGERVTPYVQALFGGAHASELTSGGVVVASSENAFAMALGGGLDVKASEHIAIRLIQAEYVMTRFSSETQNNVRISAGIVFRFGTR